MIRRPPRSPLFPYRRSPDPPAFGVSLLLAVPLLATIGSPRRWRRRPDAVDPSTEDTAGGYPTSPAPAYANYPGAPIYTDRKSTRLNSSHLVISYAVFCLKKK